MYYTQSAHTHCRLASTLVTNSGLVHTIILCVGLNLRSITQNLCDFAYYHELFMLQTKSCLVPRLPVVVFL